MSIELNKKKSDHGVYSCGLISKTQTEINGIFLYSGKSFRIQADLLTDLAARGEGTK